MFTGSALAQSQATTGNIEGRVLDPNGAAVPNVNVSATNKDTGFGKTVMADSEGNYIIVLLPPGVYKVEAKAASGFQPATYDNVPVTVGGKTALDINLAVGSGTTVIDVQAEGELVETTRSSVASTVNERAVATLPVNGRNFLDFATLTPGVVRDPTRGGDLTVGGQKGTFNSLQVDGADNNNTFFGQSFGRTGTRPPYQFSIETVKEFQINQNGFSAEFGRAAGAVINVVTKSGTNSLSGGAFLFFRDEALNSNTPILTARGAKRPKSQIKQFGGRLGGPIVKDRVFYFFAYDGQRANVPQVVDVPNINLPANAAARTLLLPKLGTYDIGRQQDVFLFKTDFNINERNQVWVRFNQQNFTGKNNENSGPLSVEEHSGNSKANTTTLAGTWTSTLRTNIFNEFRMQWGRDSEPGEANSDQPEARIQTGQGFLTIGRNNFSPRETTIKRFQVIDNVTFLVGSHNIKTGVDFNFDKIFNFFPGIFTGQYTFNSFAAFVANTPATYIQNFGGAGTTGPETHPDNNEYAFFVQDDWKIRPEFTLNLGLRYDYQEIAKPPITNPNAALLAAGYDTGFQPKDKNNFAPRIGAAYSINEKTVVRGGYGMFYARTPAIMTGTAHSQNGIQVTGVSLTCNTTPTNPCPTYPAIFSTVPTGSNVTTVTPSLFLFSKDYKQPLVHQGRVGVERELFANMSLAVSYMVFKGQSLSLTRDVNLFQPETATVNGFTFQRFPTTRPIAGFNRIQLFDSKAKSFYQGLAFELKKRFANRYQFGVAYTYSKTKDSKPDQTAVVVGADDSKYIQNQLDVDSEYGRSDLDIPHRFVANATYETGKFKWSGNKVLRALLSDYTISGILTLQSGFAYSATVSGDLNRDGNPSNDRVPGTERNQFTTPNVYILDMRLGRVIKFTEKYRLTLLAEGFNIFNRSNVSNVNRAQYSTALTTPNANFGLPSAFLGERQFQLGVKFDF